MMLKKLLIPIFSLCFLTACWDYKPIDKMLTVTGVSFDIEDDQYLVGVEVSEAVPGESGFKLESYIFEGKGDTPNRAMANILTQVAGTFYLDKCDLVLIGDNIAKDNLKPLVDVLMRNSVYHLTGNLAITKDVKALDVLKMKTKQKSSVSLDISQNIVLNASQNSLTVVSPLYQVFNSVDTPTSAVAMTCISVTTDNAGEPITNTSGAALILGGKLVSYLDAQETLYYNLISGKVNSGRVTLEGMNSTEAEIINNKSGVTAKAQDSGYSVDFAVKCIVALESESAEDTINTVQDVAEIEQKLTADVNEGITNLVNKIIKEAKCDLFSIKSKTRSKSEPEQFLSMLENSQINVKTSVYVDNTNLAK